MLCSYLIFLFLATFIFTTLELWLLRLSDKKVYQLTADEGFHVRDYRWHPASTHIAITAMPAPDMAVLLETRIYLLTVDSLAIRPLTPLRTNSPCWSPDGRRLAYQRGVYEETAGAFYKNAHLEIITLANGTIERVKIDFDEDVNPLIWLADGIYFSAVLRTTIHLFCVPSSGGTITQITPVAVDGFVAFDFSFAQEGAQAAAICADADTFWEGASLDLTAYSLTKLTTFNAATADWQLPKHELYQWQSNDGTEIEGVLTRPLDFDPTDNKKYPLLVVIHGGPASVSLRTRSGRYERHFYPIYQWVAQGAIVLQPNYRGSGGYGEAFRGLNVRDLGLGDYADVISGVGALIDEGWVDGDKVGAMGWSQGGYISAFITCYSDRFKAVSVGAGISNWVTYYVNTDIHPFTRSYLKDTPWNDPKIYAQTSPMTYIKNAQTPTLIQHGSNDSRVPLPNAYELHQGLLDQGVESKLIVYPGMPHGPTNPKQVRHILTDNLNWFNRHIFGLAAEPAAPPTLYIIVPPVDVADAAVSRVLKLSRPDEAIGRFWQNDGQLGEAESVLSDALTIEQTAAVAQRLAAQLAEMGVRKVVVFTPQTADYPAALTALGCVQIAAGSVGRIEVEHRPLG